MGLVNTYPHEAIQSYGDQIYGIDIHEGHITGRTSAYVIKGPKNILIDTGSTICQPYLLEGLQKLDLAPEDMDYVIITHIHLDHSGGTGTLLPLMPNATVVVHPRGARHLIDPSRLIEGAKAAWGEKLDEIFGAILPVPEERILIRAEGDTLDIGNGRVLTFYDTPGHAKHHFSIWDPQSRSVFCGDTFGLRLLPTMTGWDFIEIFPSSSPSDFDPQAVEDSSRKIAALNPDYLFHAHYGRSDHPAQIFERVNRIVWDYNQLGIEHYKPDLPVEEFEEVLRNYVREDLRKNGHDPHLSLDGFEMDLKLNAKGILYKISTDSKRPGAI